MKEHRDRAVAGADGVPSWLRPHDPENRLPVVIAVAVAVVGQLAIPAAQGLQPRWLIPVLEGLLVLTLTGLRIPAVPSSDRLERALGICVVAAITVDTMWSAFVLDRSIVTAQRTAADPRHLLLTGAAIYGTNIIAFGIWYWILDRGGPHARARVDRLPPDFLFPQMGLDAHLIPAHWRPHFADYLYVSYTNVVAFSPTDTLPLTRWAKALMTAQSITAFTTTALVIARAVNILT